MEDLLQSQIRDSCRLAMPEGLKDLMSDISREVLREQPADLYQFIVDYLSALLLTREALSIASRLCHEVCEGSCQPELDEELRNIGLEGEELETAKNVVMKYFDKGEVKEGNLLMKLLHETEIDEDVLPAIQNAVRVAFLKHQLKHQRMLQGKTGQASDSAYKAAKHTLRLYEAKFDQNILEQAATKIQAGFRGHLTRRHLQLNEKEEAEEFTGSYQSMTLKEKEEYDEDEKPAKPRYMYSESKIDRIRDRAATKIQACFRGYLVRHRLFENKEEVVKVTGYDEAKVKADHNVVREDKTAKHNLRFHESRTDQDTNTALKAKQKKADEVDQPVKHSLRFSDSGIDQDLKDKAATIIQACFRGYFARRYLVHKIKDAIMKGANEPMKTKSSRPGPSKPRGGVGRLSSMSLAGSFINLPKYIPYSAHDLTYAEFEEHETERNNIDYTLEKNFKDLSIIEEKKIEFDSHHTVHEIDSFPMDDDEAEDCIEEEGARSLEEDDESCLEDDIDENIDEDDIQSDTNSVHENIKEKNTSIKDVVQTPDFDEDINEEIQPQSDDSDYE